MSHSVSGTRRRRNNNNIGAFGESYQYVVLPSGENQPHASVITHGFYYVLIRSSPSRVRRFTLNDLNTSIVQAHTGGSSNALEIVKKANNGLIYFHRYGNVWQLNPDTLAFQVVTAPDPNTLSFANMQGMASDGLYIWGLGTERTTPYAASELFRWTIDNWANPVIIKVLPDFAQGHSLFYDQPSGKLFGSGHQSTGVGSWVARFDPRNAMSVEQVVRVPDTSNLTDDCTIAGNYLYVGSESTKPGKIIKINKNDLTDQQVIFTCSTTGQIWSMFFDGTWVWGLENNQIDNIGKLHRIDPVTNVIKTFIIPSDIPNAWAINEMVTDGTSLFCTTFSSPSTVFRWIPPA